MEEKTYKIMNGAGAMSIAVGVFVYGQKLIPLSPW